MNLVPAYTWLAIRQKSRTESSPELLAPGQMNSYDPVTRTATNGSLTWRVFTSAQLSAAVAARMVKEPVLGYVTDLNYIELSDSGLFDYPDEENFRASCGRHLASDLGRSVIAILVSDLVGENEFGPVCP